MSLTNDPQAGYVAEQRELLSDHYIEKQLKYIEALVIACKVVGHDIGEDISLANEAVKTLQAMLASGELMVSKTVNVADLNDASYTELTGFMQDCECGATLAPPMNFCPGCGARIIE